MRQLVAIARADELIYLTHDGEGDVRQLAQIARPGAADMDVRTIIEIGISLEALQAQPTPKARPAQAVAGEETPQERQRRYARESYHRNKGKRGAKPAKRAYQQWGASSEAVVAYLRAHPEGATNDEIALAVCGSDVRGAKQSVNACLGALKGVISTPIPQSERDGVRGPRVRYSLAPIQQAQAG